MRKIETAESLPGAKIVLLKDTRDTLTTQQAEIVAVGFPSLCDAEDCEREHVWDPCGAATPNADGWDLHDRFHPPRLHVGDWVLLAPRSLTEGPDPETYFVNQDDVLAVLSP